MDFNESKLRFRLWFGETFLINEASLKAKTKLKRRLGGEAVISNWKGITMCNFILFFGKIKMSHQKCTRPLL